VNRPAAAIATGLAALIGFVLRPILVAVDKLPGIDAHNLYAWEVYTRSVFRTGRLPFWNPYFFTGVPHLADLQTQVFYPPALILRWLPVPTFLSVETALHLWIAAIGTMVLARVAGTGWIAAAAAATAIALGGSSGPWIHNGHLLLLESASWLPWICAFALQSTERNSALPMVGLVAACGLQFLTGNLQGTLYTAAALTTFYLFALAWPGVATRRQLVTQWAMTGLLTAGAVAFQLVPTGLLVREAGRTGQLPWEAAAEGGWRAADLVRIVRPFTGFPPGASYRDLGDSAVYVGLLLVLAVPLAFVSAERRRVAAFFALLGLGGIAVAASAWLPLYRLHYTLFPGLRIPGRVLFVTTLSLAMLGALGLDQALSFIRRRSLLAARVAGAVAIAVVAFDLAAFAAPAIEPVSLASASSVVTAAVRRSGGRVLSICDHRISAGEMLVAQRPSLDGVPGMHLGHYADWAAITRSGTFPPRDGMYRRISSDGEAPVRRDLIDAANVGTILTCGPATMDGLEQVDDDGLVRVYRNTSAWPRAVWTCSANPGSADAVMTRLLATPLSRDPRTSQAGLTSPARDQDRAAESAGGGPDLLVGTEACADRGVVFTQVEDRSDGRLVLRFDAPVNGVVLISDAYYPERRAYVDGQRVPAFKANVAFTAIRVPAGQHRVELRFVPVSFYAGAVITAITLSGWAASVYRTRRRSA